MLCEAEWFLIRKWSNHFWLLLLNCIDTHYYSAFQLRTTSNLMATVSMGMKSVLMGDECFATRKNKHPSRSKVSF